MPRHILFFAAAAALPWAVWAAPRPWRLPVHEFLVPALVALGGLFLYRSKVSHSSDGRPHPGWFAAAVGAFAVMALPPALGYAAGWSVFTYGTMQSSAAYWLQALWSTAAPLVLTAVLFEWCVRGQAWAALERTRGTPVALLVTTAAGSLVYLPQAWLGFDPSATSYVAATLSTTVLLQLALGLFRAASGSWLPGLLMTVPLRFLCLTILTDNLAPALTVMNFNSSSPGFYVLTALWPLAVVLPLALAARAKCRLNSAAAGTRLGP